MMMRENIALSEKCIPESLTAYLDGELLPGEEAELELHLLECARCRTELNDQKAFMGELTRSLEHPAFVDVPEDFTRSVVVNASSNVNGLRRRNEILRAAFICIGLLAIAASASGGDVLGSASAATDKLFAIVDIVFHAVKDLVIGVSVLLRSLSSNALFGSGYSTAFVAAVFAGSLFICSRLIPRGERRETSEK